MSPLPSGNTASSVAAVDMDPADPDMSAEMYWQTTMMAVTIAMTIMGSIAVSLRFFTRSYIVGTLYSDDWVMLGALIWNFGYAIEVLIAAKSFNAGFKMDHLTEADKIGIVQIVAAVVVTYKAVLTLIKVSILCFYLRIAVRPKFAQICKYTMYLVITFEFIVLFVTVGECVPLRKMWDFSNSVPGYCIDSGAFFEFASVFHILTDAFVLLLPIPLLRTASTTRTPREKYALYFVFSVGAIAVLTAAFRFKFLHAYVTAADPFYEFAPLMTWSMVEVNVGILCACLPTLRPLFSKSQRQRTRAVKGFSMQKKGIVEAADVGDITPGHSRTNSQASNASFGLGKELGIDISTLGGGLGGNPVARQSFRPPVPPKSPPPVYGQSHQAVEAGLRATEDGLRSPVEQPRQLKLLRRDENGMFKPEFA